jgi:uncharacterized protein
VVVPHTKSFSTAQPLQNLPYALIFMTTFEQALIFGAAILAGGLNAIAGGGSFIAFPVLIFLGIPPINANATTTVAMLPGTIGSMTAYRHQLSLRDQDLLVLGATSLVGGILGAIILLKTPQDLFLKLLPYLLLSATLLFTFSQPLTQWLNKLSHKLAPSNRLSKLAMPLFQAAIAIYGGFFGGGIGILMLALLAFMGMENINKMNATKTVLSVLINGIASIPFALSGIIAWEQAIFMGIGASLGGFLSAHYAQKLNPILIRRIVTVAGSTMTIYFFVRTYS